MLNDGSGPTANPSSLSSVIDIHHLIQLFRGNSIMIKNQRSPTQADLLFRDAIQARIAKDWDKVESLCQKVIHLDAGQADAHFMLADAVVKKDRHGEAIDLYRRAIQLKPTVAEYHNSLGKALSGLERFDEAVMAYAQALRLKPKYAVAYNNLGNTLMEQCKWIDAIIAFKKALSLKPDFPTAYHNLGIALMSEVRYDEAEVCLKKSLELKETAEVHITLGMVMERVNRFEAAMDHFIRAGELDPTLSDVFYAQGNLLKTQGRFKESTEKFRQVVKMVPSSPGANYSLAHSQKYSSVDHEDIVRVREILRTSNQSSKAIATLHFTLGKMLDDCGRFEEAFDHYKKGNTLQKQRISYQFESEKAYFERLKTFFDSSFFDRYRNSGLSTEQPVFIIGLPRSGTTLTERIIAAHPDVIGVGESTAIKRLIDALPIHAPNREPYPECLRDITVEDVKKLSGQVLDVLKNLAGRSDVARIVDKMPYNFFNVGLIALLFPRARIIHCRREPMDNALSLYFRMFEYGNHFSYDLDDITSYFLAYESLMAHWRRVSPIPVFDLKYENLVANQEKISRDLIEHVGLEWHDACLNFHKESRTSRTASAWQENQPVYFDSVERWRHYESFVGSMKNLLA